MRTRVRKRELFQLIKDYKCRMDFRISTLIECADGARKSMRFFVGKARLPINSHDDYLCDAIVDGINDRNA